MWAAQNKKVHYDKSTEVMILSEQLNRLALEHSTTWKTKKSAGCHRWQPPPPPRFIKINSNCVIREEFGVVTQLCFAIILGVVGTCVQKVGYSLLLVGEAIAVQLGVEKAKSCSWGHVVLESDSTEVVRAINQ